MNKYWLIAPVLIAGSYITLAQTFNVSPDAANQNTAPKKPIVGAAPFSGQDPDQLRKQAEQQRALEAKKLAEQQAQQAQQAQQTQQSKQAVSTKDNQPNQSNQPNSSGQPPGSINEIQNTGNPVSNTSSQANGIKAPAPAPARTVVPAVPTENTNTNTPVTPTESNQTETPKRDNQDFIRGY